MPAASSIEIPEHLEIWLESAEGVITHVSGGYAEEGQEGINLAAEGTDFTDMFESPFTTLYQSAAFQLGGTYNGITEDMFKFKLVFNIKPTPNMTWRQSFSRFRKTLSPVETGYIHARVRGVSHRKLAVRLEKTSNLITKYDPNGQKFGQIVIFFVGAYPRWVEEDYTDEYIVTTDTTGAGITAPTASTPTSTSTGGTLAAATYYYKVTTLAAGGESAGSNEVSKAVTGSTSKITLTWGAKTGATGYKIYRSTTSGTEKYLATVGAVTTYADTGTATTSTNVPTSSTIPSSESGFVTVWNPTNTLCWVKWMAQAGNDNIVWTVPDFSWGSDDWGRATADAARMIILPALVNGENIKIDTNPYAFSGQVVSSLDTQVYLRMNGVQFLYPVQARTPPTQIPIQVSKAAIGNGIQLRCPLEWIHPFGGE